MNLIKSLDFIKVRQGLKSMVILKNPKTVLKIGKSTANLFTENNSVTKEACDRHLFIHATKLNDFKQQNSTKLTIFP